MVEVNTVLQFMGISGSGAMVAGVVWYLAKRCMRSSCVRRDDGYHLDIAFNPTEIETIRNDQDLRRMLTDLRGEITRRSNHVHSPSQRPTVEVKADDSKV